MAFVEQDRAYIRNYLGYAGIFLQADPRLESAISNIQAVSSVDPVAVGGTRPDQSSENLARNIVAKLVAIDAALDALDAFEGVEKVDDGSFNMVREDARLRRKGRMYVYRLAKLLDTEPRGDVFGTTPAQGTDLRATAAYAPLAMGGRTAY